MGGLFELMFDGWSCGVMHFIAVVAVYDVAGEVQGRHTRHSPIKHGQSAHVHVQHLSAILSVNRRTSPWSSFSLVIIVQRIVSGDETRDPIGGMCNHRFNLAVVCLLTEYEDLIAQIQKLMTLL